MYANENNIFVFCEHSDNSFPAMHIDGWRYEFFGENIMRNKERRQYLKWKGKFNLHFELKKVYFLSWARRTVLNGTLAFPASSCPPLDKLSFIENGWSWRLIKYKYIQLTYFRCINKKKDEKFEDFLADKTCCCRGSNTRPNTLQRLCLRLGVAVRVDSEYFFLCQKEYKYYFKYIILLSIIVCIIFCYAWRR